MRHPRSPNKLGGAYPTSTAGQSVIVYDDTITGHGRPGPAPSDVSVTVAFQLDQEVTFIVKWAPERDAGDASLVIVNGATQTGEAASANAFFRRNVVLSPGRNQISVLMGTPAPTANYIGVESNTFDGLVT